MKNNNKSFGIVFSIFFGILFLYFYSKSSVINYYLLSLSLIFLILGLANSKILTPLNKSWIKLGDILAKIIAPIIMSVVYFLIVFPTKIFLFLIGKDILNLKINSNEKSYWQKRTRNYTSMDNQF
ncbi:SxtJ family membrane protein [Pelagibacteraceae bacterium]|nr:SxtJ family membrane protein [Pelagibacteraceae bacterium]